MPEKLGRKHSRRSAGPPYRRDLTGCPTRRPPTLRVSHARALLSGCNVTVMGGGRRCCSKSAAGPREESLNPIRPRTFATPSETSWLMQQARNASYFPRIVYTVLQTKSHETMVDTLVAHRRVFYLVWQRSDPVFPADLQHCVAGEFDVELP